MSFRTLSLPSLRGLGLALLTGWLLAPTSLLASAGQPDESFGSDGTIYVPIDLGGTFFDLGYDIALQSDGKILLTGLAVTANGSEVVVARLLPSGSFDSTFGTNGQVTIAVDLVTDGDDEGTVILVQPDGKILIGGSAQASTVTPDTDLVVIRLLADGTLDSSFGSAGIARIFFDIGPNRVDDLQGMALQSDGKIVIGGPVQGPTGKTLFGVARLDTQGALDPTFDSDGKVFYAFDNATDDSLHGLQLQPDGKILLGGEAFGISQGDFGLIRLTTDGSLDTTFGVQGKLSVDFFADRDILWDLEIDAAGRILAAGSARSGTDDLLAFARLLPNGTLDPSFSGDGRATVDFTSTDSGHAIRAVELTSDGKIVGVGSIRTSQPSDFDTVVVRLQADGTLDPTFGSGGRTRIALQNVAEGPEFALGGVLDTAGRIYAVGSSLRVEPQDYDITLTRLTGDGNCIFTDSFESDSTARWSQTVQ